MTTGVKTVYLINAGNDPTRTSVPNDSAFPALGVLSLGTTLQHYFPKINVQVFDGQVTPREYIDSAIKGERPDIVGISVLATSLQNALHYAETAKNTDATVILGNDQAAITGRTMMEKRIEIDYVSTADVGELPFVQFIQYLNKEIGVTQVPQLMYRENGGIRHNTTLPELLPSDRYTALDQIPVVNRKLLTPPEAWKMYLKNYLARYGRFHEKEIKGITTMNRARGCHRVKDACTYCGILDLSLRFSSPEMFWKEVIAGREQVNADIFYEVFDNMTSAPKRWLRALIDGKPTDLDDVEFFVYAQALGLDEERIQLLKQLGVHRLNMGLDSGDDLMLKRLKGPQDSVEYNRRTAELAKKYRMGIYASFVLGAPGENPSSLSNTTEFVKWLIDGGYIAAVESQPLFPEFNAKAGRMLMDPKYAREQAEELGFRIQDKSLLEKMPEKWKDNPSPNPDEIARDWASIFCEVDYDELEKTAEEIRNYARDSGYSYGQAFF